jgi:hypothetical protein
VPPASALYQVERLALLVDGRTVGDFMGTAPASKAGAACGATTMCFVAEPPAYQEPGVDVFTAIVEKTAPKEESARPRVTSAAQSLA